MVLWQRLIEKLRIPDEFLASFRPQPVGSISLGERLHYIAQDISKEGGIFTGLNRLKEIADMIISRQTSVDIDNAQSLARIEPKKGEDSEALLSIAVVCHVLAFVECKAPKGERGVQDRTTVRTIRDALDTTDWWGKAKMLGISASLEHAARDGGARSL